MDTQNMTSIEALFAEQARCLEANDLDGMVNTFHPEAVWLRFPGPIVGREAIRKQLEKYWSLGVESGQVLEFVTTGDTVMVRGEMTVNGESVVTFGVYVIRDGLVWRQCGADEGGSRDWWA